MNKEKSVKNILQIIAKRNCKSAKPMIREMLEKMKKEKAKKKVAR